MLATLSESRSLPPQRSGCRLSRLYPVSSIPKLGTGFTPCLEAPGRSEGRARTPIAFSMS